MIFRSHCTLPADMTGIPKANKLRNSWVTTKKILKNETAIWFQFRKHRTEFARSFFFFFLGGCED